MKDNTDKPLILIGLVCLLLLLMHFLPPISIGGVTLREVSVLSDLSPHKSVVSSGILPTPKAPQDTTMQKGKKQPFKEVWPKGTEPIVDYSAGSSSGMNHFYAMLDSLEHKQLNRPLRIAYFSDSYTEGDILCADLRENLQARYGGQGVGWVDAANEVNQYRISLMTNDRGMEEHMAMKKEEYQAAKAGIAARYAPFSGNAMLNYTGGTTYPHASKWQVVRFLLRTPGAVSVSANLGGVTTTHSVSGSGVQEATFTSAQPVGRTTISLHGTGTAFGTALEGTTGIVLDDYAMRSASGLHLFDIPEETLKQFQALRHYDLIIIAFGGNIVSAKSKPSDCEWYIGSMKKVVERFKTCFAGSSILLFGAPDMGARMNGVIDTPESIKALVSYQNQMASECHVGFYNLLNAMGGYGSAGRLHEQKMIGADLFHISPKGGKYIADRIFKSIEAGHKNYIRKKATKK